MTTEPQVKQHKMGTSANNKGSLKEEFKIRRCPYGMSSRQLKMQVLRANKSTSRYAIYFQPHHRCLRVLISGYLKKELEEPFLSATLCTLPPPPSTSVLHGHLCFKLKLFYVNRSQGLAGTVVNWRWTPELKRKAFTQLQQFTVLPNVERSSHSSRKTKNSDFMWYLSLLNTGN